MQFDSDMQVRILPFIIKCENSSVGRILASQAKGHEFESRFSLKLAHIDIYESTDNISAAEVMVLRLKYE